MIYCKLTNVLYAVAFLATRAVAAEDAHALEVFPELRGQGPAEVAYLDPKTHKVAVEHIDEHGKGIVEKRSYPVNQDTVPSLLRNHNGYGFCKAYCPQYELKCVTKTTLKTATKVVTVTSSIVPAPTTVTGTVTGEVPTDSTVLQTSVVTETTNATLTDAPRTTTEVETITIVSSATSLLTETITVGMPSAPTVLVRGVSPPSWLGGVADNHICLACIRVWPAPPAKTVTVCKGTTTITSTKTQTVTNDRATATTIVSITPTANTVTAVISTTLVLTDTTTITPITTETSTTSTTLSTTVTSTATQTVCPQQTSDVNGIRAVTRGRLVERSAVTPAECCLACFREADGCTEWALLSPRFCILSVPGTGTGAPTQTCPNGKGSGALFSAPGSNPNGFGGPGQCQG